MKTRLEWRHEDKVLKLNDTNYDQFPQDGDVIEMDEAGETQKFRVTGIESAVVILETVADDEEITPTRESSKARKNRRLADERGFRAHRSNTADRARTAQQLSEVRSRAHDSALRATQTKTFRVARSNQASKAQKSKPLSRTARGNKTATAKRR